MNSSHRRPQASRPRDRFFDEKYRMLGRPVSDAMVARGGGRLPSARCTVIGASLFGVTALMAAPPLSEVPAGQPLEPVGGQATGVVAEVPKLVPPSEVGSAAGVGSVPVPVVPPIGTVADTVTPPLSLPVNPPSAAAEGALPEGELVPLESAALTPASAGDAALAGESATASDASAGLSDAALDGSREVDRQTLDQLQESGQARPWMFSLIGGVTYDDNIQFQQTGGDQLSDVILNSGFSSSYNMPSGSIIRTVNAVLGASYLAYLENDEFSGWNANAGLSTEIHYGEFTGNINLSAGQLNGADRMVGGFSVSRNYSGGLSGSYDISEKTRLTGGFSLSIVDYQQQSYQSQPFSGNAAMSASLGANYAVTPKTRLGGNYTWSSNEQQDFSTWSYSAINATAAWSATAKTSLSASVGRQVTSLSGVERGDGPGWVGSLGGAWQASERMAFTVGFTRSAASAAVGGNGAMNFNAFNVGLTRTLTDRLSGAVRFNYRAEEYEDLEGTDEFQGRDVTYWTVDTSLSWQISARASLMLRYQFQNNESSLESWNFSGNRVGLNFTYSF